MDSLPTFPEFTHLTLDHKNLFSDVVRKYGTYSDFTFMSLWTYNTENDVIISSLNGNVVVRFRDYLTNEHFYSFIGDTKTHETILTLLSFIQGKNCLPYLKLVPEVSLPHVSHNAQYRVTEDSGNFDYIYDSHALATLDGKAYYGKRKQLQAFQQNHSNCHIETIDVTHSDIQKHLVDVMHTWAEKKQKSTSDIEHEMIAITRLLRDASILDPIALGLFEEKKMIGFALASQTTHESAEFHFVKADYAYKGIFAALYSGIAKEVVKKGLRYLNNEQDFGIEGLREAKKQWNPVQYLKKYTISPNT